MADNTSEPGWVYKPDDNSTDQNVQEQSQAATETPAEPIPPTPAQQSVSWTASEFIHHHKNTGWYLLFALAIGLTSGLIYLLTKDLISAFVIAFAGLLFAILASHKPRELPYVVDQQGISINHKLHPYSDFKSFAFGEEGAIGAINLLPLKRFMPELTIYYPREEETKITDILSAHLPHDQREEHHVDKLLKKLRF